ncbi:MAG: hypothetical protein B0D92_07940 [Spirochaeta sp. LUC14_002_19_P3]|nr:MAG: hypothetical protein B0D92_07940 [Spirochaeta sp. LUC14_002_19_P3]
MTALRLLFGAALWTLFGAQFYDVIPMPWLAAAFPLAAITGWLLYRFKLTPLPAIGLMALLPWLLRGIVFTAAVVIQKDWQVYWDRGWLLGAPLWYFTAISHYAVPRRPFLGYIEALIQGIFGAVFLSSVLQDALTVPQLEGLRLLLSIVLFILTFLCFAAVFRRIRPPSPAAHRPSQAVYMLALALLLFLLITMGNRARLKESVSAGGGLLTSNLFRFDFSDVLSLEPQIDLNAELTMLYREDAPPEPRYLRRFTLSGWNEKQGFFRDPPEHDHPEGPPLPADLPKGTREWESPPFELRQPVKQQYYLAALDPDSLFALNSPYRIIPWNIWDDASFVRAYSVESMVSYAGEWELEDAPAENFPEEHNLLRGGDDAWFRAKAAEIIGAETSRWKQAAAIETWLRENYYYSLKPGLAPDGNQLSWFLNTTKRGYCSYFAFAMARLCRAAGIPTRVAVGFLTDPETSVLGFIPVSSDRAHAWVEVWMGSYGWITFDPTSNTMAPGEDYPVQFISPDKWLPLIEEVLTRSGEISIALEEEEEESAPFGMSWWKNLASEIRNRPLTGLLAVLLMLLLLYLPGRLLPWAGGLRTAGTMRGRVKGQWRSFARSAVRGGFKVRPGETILAWAARLEAGGLYVLKNWTQLYLKAEFSPHFDTDDAQTAAECRQAARKAWKALRWNTRIRARLSPGWGAGLPWSTRT